MKFIQIKCNFPGAEKSYVIGAGFDRSAWHDEAADADVLAALVADILKRNDGALDLLCSDGVQRRIGSGLMKNAIIEYQVVEIADIAWAEVPIAA